MTYRALVVDDNPDILEMVGDVLDSLGHEFDTATCQDEARRLLAERHYSYHLLDLEIPVRQNRGFPRIQNGENLLREIAARRNGRPEPILVMTGHGTDSPKLAVQMMKLGAADYITKPFATAGRTLDQAILEALEAAERPDPPDSVPHQMEAEPLTIQPFRGGTLQLSPYRAELLGATVWRGRPQTLAHRILECLRERRPNGRFVAFSGMELAEKAGCSGDTNRISGAIRDLRREISRVLLADLGVQCGAHDVIQSGGPGYRFREWIVIGSGVSGDDSSALASDNALGTGGTAIGTDGDCRIAVENADGPDQRSAVRHRWILGELSKGRRLRIPDICQSLGVSPRTAKRDIGALRAANQIEFLGTTRTGYYRSKSDTTGSTVIPNSRCPGD